MSYLFDQKAAKKDLKKFFKKNKPKLQSFGSRVNQTFEAYVFAKTIEHYKNNGWRTTIINPPKTKRLRLKFSMRGAPAHFSYCKAKKNNRIIQIRHQLRVEIMRQFRKQKKPANICCDIVIMEDTDIDHYNTNTALPNNYLISFGEVKHMSAFAELIASFVGLVYELQPKKLKRIRTRKYRANDHLQPFLYVSGVLYSTAGGITESIRKRKYDIDIYSYDDPIN